MFLIFDIFLSYQTCRTSPDGHVLHVFCCSSQLSTKNTPLWACFRCLTYFFLTRHVEHAQTGMFYVSLDSLPCRAPKTRHLGVSFGVRHIFFSSDTQNTPRRACFTRLSVPFPVEHQRRIHLGVLLVFDVFSFHQTCTTHPYGHALRVSLTSFSRAPKMCPSGRVLGVRHVFLFFLFSQFPFLGSFSFWYLFIGLISFNIVSFLDYFLFQIHNSLE